MAEVHVVGSIARGEDFEEPSLLCKWSIVTDDGRADNKRWTLLEGYASGQTQVDAMSQGEPCVWSYPLDLHYSTTALQGWPKFHCEVWSQDSHGRNSLAGYGFCYIPSSPGTYELKIEETSCRMPGAYPQLKDSDVIWRQDDRYRLSTFASGVVILRISVITLGFEKHGIQYSSTS